MNTYRYCNITDDTGAVWISGTNAVTWLTPLSDHRAALREAQRDFDRLWTAFRILCVQVVVLFVAAAAAWLR